MTEPVATLSGFKRPRSPVQDGEHDRDTKKARNDTEPSPFFPSKDALGKAALDFALGATGFKRPRSPSSSDHDDDDDTKRSRPSFIPCLDFEPEDRQLDLSLSDKDVAPIPPRNISAGKLVSAISFQGLTLRKPYLATVAADGSFIALTIDKVQTQPHTQSSTPPSTPGTTQDKKQDQTYFPGLATLTPPITPSPSQEKQHNPLDSYYNKPSATPDPSPKKATYKSLPSNFVIVGDVDLYGCIPAKLHIFQGAVTQLHPYAEVVTLSTSQVTIGSILPELKDGPFDAIVLEKPRFCYAVQALSKYELEGFYFDTDVMFQGLLQPVSDIIKDIFHQDKPSLHVSAYLGATRSWTKPYVPPRLVLRGSFENCSVNLWDVLEFTQIGVELTLDRTSEDMHVGYGLFGKVNVTVPGSMVPLQAEYLFRAMDEQYMLCVSLTDEDWKDCFGIQGLTLSEVNFVGILSEASSDSQLFLELEAVLQLNNTTFSISGSYSKDEYCLEAFVGHLTLQEVGNVFQQFTGHQLDVFDHDIVFDSLSLVLSSDGIMLTGAITINGHSTAQGTIAIMKDGLHISGGVGNVEFESLTINSATFDVFISSSNSANCSRTTKFGIAGDLSFCGLDLKVGLFTEKSTGEELQWTIYGEAVGDMSVGRLNEDLRGSFLDVSLHGLAFIASNKDDPDGPYNKFRYPVKKGIQFCAAIDSIPQLEDLMRGSVKGMVLSAGYNNGSLRVGVVLPADRTITFGDTVYTGPLMLEFAKEGVEIQLILKALLNVKVDTQQDPLKFSLGLKASCSGAAAYAQMMNDWANPCNVGKDVVIRGCALEFGIVYATFFTTGMPGAIGLAGQLMIGKKEAKVAMKLSQNPKEQVLAAAVKDLGVVDLVQFASVICEYDFPEPDDFLHFNDMQLYLSTGATIGETYYPPGASMKGDMTIFGKKAKFECTIGSMVKISATIEHFDLGPLTVKGAVGADPIVDIEISSSRQRVLIDGAVELWALSAALHLEAEMYPSPKFDFWVDVSLSDWFKFKLEAKLTGDINFKDLKSLANADFSVYGLMEQHIMEHIIEMLDKQINSMHENSDFDDAKRRLAQKENEFYASIQTAQSRFDDATRAWQQKELEVTTRRDGARADAEAYLKRLQNTLDEAEKALKAAVANATAELNRVTLEASVATRLAESALAHAQHDSDESIRQLQDDLHRKRDAFQLAFGNSPQADLEEARQAVEQAMCAVDALCEDVANLDRRLSEASLWDTAVLVAEKAAKSIEQGAASVALEAVRTILNAAEMLIQNPDFVAGEAAIQAAQDALEASLLTKAAAVDVAQASCEQVKAVQDLLLQNAKQAVYAVERTSPELLAVREAQRALAAGDSTARSMRADAEAAFKGLHTSTEFLAVGIAEKALAFARTNSAEVELARQACDLVEEHSSSFADDILEVGLNIGKWIASAAAELINITKIEFSGSISGLVGDGPPLMVKIEGKLVGQDIDIDIHWKPDFNLVKFIKAIFSELWETIKNAAGKFLEEIGAKIVELAEDIAEGVKDAAVAVGEGIEKGAQAIAEGAEIVADAIDDAASDVASALDDAASAIGDAAQDVGEAFEQVADDIDDAMSDVGSAIGDAANDIGDAFAGAADDVGEAAEDFAEGVGDAVNDVGNAVENVANDIGNAVSDFFSW